MKEGKHMHTRPITSPSPVGKQPIKSQSAADAEFDLLLNSKQVREACGGVDDVTIWRWRKNERIGFPAPDAVINGRNYWYRSKVRHFQAEQAAKTRALVGSFPPRHNSGA
jgi:hypothetical protein